MVSTFQGLEMAKRALNAQQAALYTTSHNISNANTVGYTRQRVNFEQISSLSSSREPGGVVSGVGSGVEAGSIERIRDQFLDTQYRKENSKYGYYQSQAQALKQMENLLNEPTEEGLAFVLEDFFNSLQDLNGNADHAGTRTVVAQRGEAVAETFRYLSSSIKDVQDDLKNQIDVTVEDLNSILKQIDAINNEIAGIEPHGLVPNDLYDERDRLIDTLSTMVDIEVSYGKSSGQPSPIAEGIATITLKNGDQHISLVDGDSRSYSQFEVSADSDGNITEFTITNEELNETETILAADFTSKGSMKALLEMNGYVDGNEIHGYYNEVKADLELMLVTYAEEFNKVHQAGFDLDGNQGGEFFTFDENDPLGTIAVNEEILNNPDLIAASSKENSGTGDGTNAIDLAEVYNKLGAGEFGERTSVKSFYQSLIGELGVKTKEANRMTDNSAVLRQQVEENRMSVSSVSLDEEMSNLIKFQHAYNAAARSMTTVDEMLDRIINQMGLVGR
ncbi:flagellar hook-associated protein FlgK [Amphibacillus sp. MSJ-3]|uniref:flagellar hook-associated protein FlgK n=1 Tax=Amphibacillus sp. MSJ-3 TaxID=2841505 RepID=UPI001C0EC539|nr:flagellar hook-associated protein FlgK [Amphibacillus sp. MSJ-3]MBU5594108.1 flagellar hook-associated protein FlgK [Amphibacillus sp. MSJ-3]